MHSQYIEHQDFLTLNTPTTSANQSKMALTWLINLQSDTDELLVKTSAPSLKEIVQYRYCGVGFPP